MGAATCLRQQKTRNDDLLGRLEHSNWNASPDIASAGKWCTVKNEVWGQEVCVVWRCDGRGWEGGGEVCALCLSVCDKMSDDVMNKDERDKALLDKV